VNRVLTVILTLSLSKGKDPEDQRLAHPIGTLQPIRLTVFVIPGGHSSPRFPALDRMPQTSKACHFHPITLKSHLDSAFATPILGQKSRIDVLD
jgi:hypothetical protein